MTVGELVKAASVSAKTLQKLEDGRRRPQEGTRLRIETALRWTPGSIEAIRRGANPTPLPELSSRPDMTVPALAELLRATGELAAAAQRCDNAATAVAEHVGNALLVDNGVQDPAEVLDRLRLSLGWKRQVDSRNQGAKEAR